MTIVFREQLPPMEREECDAFPCILNASWKLYDLEGALVRACTAHDLRIRLDCTNAGDTVIDVTTKEN